MLLLHDDIFHQRLSEIHQIEDVYENSDDRSQWLRGYTLDQSVVGMRRLRLQECGLVAESFFNDITVIGDVRDQEQMDRELAGADLVVLLAAQHRDDISPVSLYYDTNVGGMEVTLKAMEKNGVKRLIFFSSVAIYGLNKSVLTSPIRPILSITMASRNGRQNRWPEKWYESHPDWNINIVRPTVIFGERNRGNVYNLLNQISGGKFLMVGNGRNRKSMAYVGNIVSFSKYLIDSVKDGYNVFNYIDKPDMDMNALVGHVSKVLKNISRQPTSRIGSAWPGGYCFDLPCQSLRQEAADLFGTCEKFCSTTEFDARKAHSCGFKAPTPLMRVSPAHSSLSLCIPDPTISFSNRNNLSLIKVKG